MYLFEAGDHAVIFIRRAATVSKEFEVGALFFINVGLNHFFFLFYASGVFCKGGGSFFSLQDFSRIATRFKTDAKCLFVQ